MNSIDVQGDLLQATFATPIPQADNTYYQVSFFSQNLDALVGEFTVADPSDDPSEERVDVGAMNSAQVVLTPKLSGQVVVTMTLEKVQKQDNGARETVQSWENKVTLTISKSAP